MKRRGVMNLRRMGAVGLLTLGVAFRVVAEPRDMLVKVDQLVSFAGMDFSAEYLVVQNKAGEGVESTRAVIFRRDSEQKYLIIVLDPVQDRGKGYLKIGSDLWFYDPVGRSFTFTSSAERFRNSNARNSDFTGSSFATDYDVVKTGQEKLGRFDCTILDLKATNDGVAFPITKLWISEDALVRKSEDYSLSGQLLRTMLIPTYQSVGTRFVPASIIIVDHLKGRTINGEFVGDRTQITVSKPSLSRLPANLFTKAYLEKLSQ
jgi:outer membrane lipoprotein-sorting protein